MREAGLDPESDFPPESYEHLVEIATTLTEDGPGDYGFQLHGHPFDWYTFIEPYTNALGGHEGEAGYFAEDYRSVNYDTETWKQVVADTIALYREHEVSGPQTPSIPDEDTVPLLTQGQGEHEPHRADELPDLPRHRARTDGGRRHQVRLAVERAVGYEQRNAHVRPRNHQPARGSRRGRVGRKQELAVKLAEMWFEEQVQTSLFMDTGFVPVRRDLWDQNAEQLPYNDASGAFETLTTMVDEESRGSTPRTRRTSPRPLTWVRSWGRGTTAS